MTKTFKDRNYKEKETDVKKGKRTFRERQQQDKDAKEQISEYLVKERSNRVDW